MRVLERERLLQPACLVPGFQHGMNRATDMERGRFGFLESKHIAEVELQTTLYAIPVWHEAPLTADHP